MNRRLQRSALILCTPFTSSSGFSRTFPKMTKVNKKDPIRAEQKVAGFWDRMAENYSKQPIADEESYRKKLEMTREYFTPSTRVLEFGCGTGGTAILHAPFVQDYCAIDVSEKMIDIAQSKLEDTKLSNLRFEKSGIDSLNATNGTYNAILGMSILHLLPNKDEVIQKVYTMLPPEGVFITSTICMGDFIPVMKYVGAVGTFFGLIPKISVFKAKNLRESIQSAGFEIEREFQPSKDKALFIVARKKA